VANRVRVQPFVAERGAMLRRRSNIFVENDPDAKAGQAVAARVKEHGRGLGRRNTALVDECLQEARSFRPERTGPLFVALSPKQDAEGSAKA
jgi:hypothetical protein